MAKRLTEKEKQDLVKYFSQGISVDKLATDFNCTKLTVVRNLKKVIGESTYQDLIYERKKDLKSLDVKEKNKSLEIKNNLDTKDSNNESLLNEESFYESSQNISFTELIPLDCEIDNNSQKDFASVPISEMLFPNIVYLIVDKKIELEIKYLRDYPEWSFLSEEQLNRKTIEIYFDIKLAKRFCTKEQKVIKVPNTEVFKIVAPILLKRGISKIVCDGKLISL